MKSNGKKLAITTLISIIVFLFLVIVFFDGWITYMGIIFGFIATSTLIYLGKESFTVKLKKIIENHKSTLPKAIIEGGIITLIAYSLGVLFVDVMGIAYKIIGLALIPVTFIIKYILCKYWVFASNENDKK